MTKHFQQWISHPKNHSFTVHVSSLQPNQSLNEYLFITPTKSVTHSVSFHHPQPNHSLTVYLFITKTQSFTHCVSFHNPNPITHSLCIFSSPQPNQSPTVNFFNTATQSITHCVSFPRVKVNHQCLMFVSEMFDDNTFLGLQWRMAIFHQSADG